MEIEIKHFQISTILSATKLYRQKLFQYLYCWHVLSQSCQTGWYKNWELECGSFLDNVVAIAPLTSNCDSGVVVLIPSLQLNPLQIMRPSSYLLTFQNHYYKR